MGRHEAQVRDHAGLGPGEASTSGQVRDAVVDALRADEEGDDECAHGWPACDDCRQMDEDARREYEDERRAARGTSDCDGVCDPMCDWCLVSHACPDDCGGGDACPYVGLAEREDGA